MISIDAFNLLWGLIGMLLDACVPHATSSAIGDCMKNYGFGMTVYAKVLITMSFVQSLRFALYVILFVHHQ